MIDAVLRTRRDDLVGQVEESLARDTSSKTQDAATALIEEASSLGPPSPALLCATGVLAWLRGDREGARLAFERTLILDPECAEARENLTAIVERRSQAAHFDSTPLISVIVPSHSRPETVLNLLQSLNEQTASPSEFEVIIVDDGSPIPLTKALSDYEPGFRLRLLRQENCGPATARNRAIALATAEELLILNDDAIADPGLLAGHLEARRRHGPDVAILGSFPYSDAARESPFVRVLEATNAIFAFDELNPKAANHWIFFWTCNISIRRDHVLAVGGFDERFREPMCEDIELGWRLFRERNIQVVHEPELVCHHDHRIDPAGFRRRQRMFGRNQFRFATKYDNFGLLSMGWAGPWDDKLFERIGREADAIESAAATAFGRLCDFESGLLELVPGAPVDDPATIRTAHDLVQVVALYEYLRGIHEAAQGRSFRDAPKDLRCVTAQRLHPPEREPLQSVS